MSGWMIETGIAVGGLLAGAGLAVLAGRLRRSSARPGPPEGSPEPLGAEPDPDPPGLRANGTALGPPVSPLLVGLLGRAIREPLKQLRRSEACPAEALEQLEHLAWQARMAVARPRPLQSKLVSPISMLQEAAEQVPALRRGSVGASWSLRNRQPVQVDPERATAAFREILWAGASICGDGGRLAIRILPGGEPGYPVQVEIEIGRPGVEADPLGFLVARHLLESQGARVETDGRITRVLLRSSPPEAALPPGLRL